MITRISLAVGLLTFIIASNASASLDSGQKDLLVSASGGLGNAYKRIEVKLESQGDKDKFNEIKNQAEDKIKAACNNKLFGFPETTECYAAVQEWWEEIKLIEEEGRLLTEPEKKILKSSLSSGGGVARIGTPKLQRRVGSAAEIFRDAPESPAATPQGTPKAKKKLVLKKTKKGTSRPIDIAEPNK